MTYETAIAKIGRPQIRDGVTQADIDTFGATVYKAGWEAGRRALHAEQKAARESETEQVRQALEVADALRDGGIEDDAIGPTTIRIIFGRTQ